MAEPKVKKKKESVLREILSFFMFTFPFLWWILCIVYPLQAHYFHNNIEGKENEDNIHEFDGIKNVHTVPAASLLASLFFSPPSFISYLFTCACWEKLFFDLLQAAEQVYKEIYLYSFPSEISQNGDISPPFSSLTFSTSPSPPTLAPPLPVVDAEQKGILLSFLIFFVRNIFSFFSMLRIITIVLLWSFFRIICCIFRFFLSAAFCFFYAFEQILKNPEVRLFAYVLLLLFLFSLFISFATFNTLQRRSRYTYKLRLLIVFGLCVLSSILSVYIRAQLHVLSTKINHLYVAKNFDFVYTAYECATFVCVGVFICLYLYLFITKTLFFFSPVGEEGRNISLRGGVCNKNNEDEYNNKNSDETKRRNLHGIFINLISFLLGGLGQTKIANKKKDKEYKHDKRNNEKAQKLYDDLLAVENDRQNVLHKKMLNFKRLNEDNETNSDFKGNGSPNEEEKEKEKEKKRKKRSSYNDELLMHKKYVMERELHECTLEELHSCKEQLFRIIKDREAESKYIENKEKQIVNMKKELDWIYTQLTLSLDKRTSLPNSPEGTELEAARNQITSLVNILKATREENEELSRQNRDLRDEIEDIRVYKSVGMNARHERKRSSASKRHRQYLKESMTQDETKTSANGGKPWNAVDMGSTFSSSSSSVGLSSASSLTSVGQNNELREKKRSDDFDISKKNSKEYINHKWQFYDGEEHLDRCTGCT